MLSVVENFTANKDLMEAIPNQKPTAIIVLTFDTWNSGDIYLVLPLDKYHNT